ncbi:hypothetical protein [Asaia astilbis]|uniref:hypothetical protein n=1 Tax=Asaia astilbis TaxID=610244 RepID=UPI0004719352|nr:hypothetical protein [Asaia astilbis]
MRQRHVATRLLNEDEFGVSVAAITQIAADLLINLFQPRGSTMRRDGFLNRFDQLIQFRQPGTSRAMRSAWVRQ